MGSPEWVHDYARLLFSHQHQDWDRALELKQANLPISLFRYRAPGERALSDLRDGTIWLSKPSKFNDPFDSSLALDPSVPFSTLIKKHVTTCELPAGVRERVIASSDPLAVFDEVFAAEVEKVEGPAKAVKAIGFFAKFLGAQGDAIAAALSELLQNRLKVACFCETGTSLPLWAYYADHHRGLCVEYPVSTLPADDLRRRWLHPVFYSPDRFTPAEIMDRMIQDRSLGTPWFGILAAVHKSPDWEHEREWRLVDPTGDDVPGRSILMPRPSAVYLGAKVSSEYRREIVSIIEGLRIPLREMVLSERRFELRSHPIDLRPTKESDRPATVPSPEPAE